MSKKLTAAEKAQKLAEKESKKAAKEAEKLAKKQAKEAQQASKQSGNSNENAEIYHLYIKLNDRAYEVNTDNLAEAIQSFAPGILKTKIIIKVTHIPTSRTQDRVIYLQRGRILFTNRIALEALVRSFIF